MQLERDRDASSFYERRAHFYKLVPGGGLPQEIILDGPFDVHERERRTRR